MEVPETRYAKSGDVSIAYQVFGQGAVDLVFVVGWVSNVELGWEEPLIVRFYEGLASFSRLILFDKRGTGLSDRVPDGELPNLETRMDDVRAVMDAAGSDRAVLLALPLGAPMSVLFAATYPERVVGLALYDPVARMTWAPDWPWGRTPEEYRKTLEEIEQDWGTLRDAMSNLRESAPSLVGDERLIRWFATFLRRSASPGAAIALERMSMDMDVRHVLSAVRVPSLVLAREEGQQADQAREVAARIPNARYVHLPGRDSLFFAPNQDSLLEEVERFVAEIQKEEVDLDRVLATVLVTDIVESTRRASELGDHAWKELMQAHDAEVRRHLGRHRGKEVDTAGDGFLATFDGPARAVRCARAVVDALRDLGIPVRAGLHTGEVELAEEKVRGIAVHIGARVCAMANPGEVLVSSTVRDLVAGSQLTFADRGAHALKGVPGQWHLFAATGDK